MKRVHILIPLLLALLLVGSVAAAPALVQSAERPRHVMAAGGRSVTVGSVTLRGTVGQPFVGISTGGNVTLGHGFWHGAEPRYSLYLPLVLLD